MMIDSGDLAVCPRCKALALASQLEDHLEWHARDDRSGGERP